MTLEEARAVWLLKVGSDWVGEVFVLDIQDSVVWEAYTKLRLSDSIDRDRLTHKIKIKCKS